jgi:hypothetical protein
MAFSHTISVNWSSGNRSITADNSYSGDAQASVDVSIPDSSTDMLVNFALDVSQIKAIYIKSDQDITLETNNGTTPDDTINLTAGVPYIWTTDSYDTCKLTTDVTALYATNSSGSEANLQIEVVKDDTP